MSPRRRTNCTLLIAAPTRTNYVYSFILTCVGVARGRAPERIFSNATFGTVAFRVCAGGGREFAKVAQGALPGCGECGVLARRAVLAGRFGSLRCTGRVLARDAREAVGLRGAVGELEYLPLPQDWQDDAPWVSTFRGCSRGNLFLNRSGSEKKIFLDCRMEWC